MKRTTRSILRILDVIMKQTTRSILIVDQVICLKNT